MRPPACCATWEWLSPSKKHVRTGVLPWRPMRNITHRLFRERRARTVSKLAEEAIVQGRRIRAARDEVALLRWLARSAHSAVALARGGHLTLTNGLFRELDGREGEWRRSVGPHPQLRYRALRALGCGGAPKLP